MENETGPSPFVFDGQGKSVEGVIYGPKNALLLHTTGAFADGHREELYVTNMKRRYFLIVHNLAQMDFALGLEERINLVVPITLLRAEEWVRQHAPDLLIILGGLDKSTPVNLRLDLGTRERLLALSKLNNTSFNSYCGAVLRNHAASEVIRLARERGE